MNIGSFYFTCYAKNSKFQPIFGGAKGGANQEIFHLHLFCLCLTLFVNMLHSETLSTFP